jgi:hypothetical protein
MQVCEEFIYVLPGGISSWRVARTVFIVYIVFKSSFQRKVVWRARARGQSKKRGNTLDAYDEVCR